MGTLQLEVVTPDKTVVSGEVEMAVCPGIEGEFGVLPKHVSLLSALKIGGLRYRTGGKDEHVFISGGFADVNNDVLTVLAGAVWLVLLAPLGDLTVLLLRDLVQHAHDCSPASRTLATQRS